MVFNAVPVLDSLSCADNWFCGAIFPTAPNVFFQIYTIHASVDGVQVPIVYALLPNNKEDTYIRLLNCFEIELIESVFTVIRSTLSFFRKMTKF